MIENKSKAPLALVSGTLFPSPPHPSLQYKLVAKMGQKKRISSQTMSARPSEFEYITTNALAGAVYKLLRF